MGNIIITITKIIQIKFPINNYIYPKKDLLINQSYYYLNKKIEDNNILLEMNILNSNENINYEEVGMFI
jgi:hypothetical protein